MNTGSGSIGFGRCVADPNLGSMGEGGRSECGTNCGIYPAHLDGVLKNKGPDSPRGMKSGNKNELEEKVSCT